MSESPRGASRQHAKLGVALLMLAAAGALTYWQRDTGAGNEDLEDRLEQHAYQLACAECKAEYEMSAVDYAAAVKARGSDLEGIECRKCGKHGAWRMRVMGTRPPAGEGSEYGYRPPSTP